MLKAYVFVLSYHAFHKKTTVPIFSNKYAEFKRFIWSAPLPSHSRGALWFAYDSGLTGQLPSCPVTGPGPSAHGRSDQGKCTLGSAAQRVNDLGAATSHAVVWSKRTGAYGLSLSCVFATRDSKES